jgi:outer membrane biosynthesis protein TonB
MRKTIAGAAGAVAIVAAAVTACGTSAPSVVRAPEPKPTVTKTVTAKPSPATVKTVQPKPAATRTPTQAPAASTRSASTATPAPSPSTSSAAATAGYLGDIFGGGTGNPCNFASGYQSGVCNPTGETEQQYIANPGAPAPGTSTNAQGCYYVKMGEGYCPSTGQYVPMQDPNG